MRRVLHAGAKRFNWHVLTIHDFINKADQALAKFESLVNQIQKNAKDIENRIEMMERTNLFQYPEPDYSNQQTIENTSKSIYQNESVALPTVKEFFEKIDRERKKDVETITAKYRAIGPLLTKMEGLICQTNTGKSKNMAVYYKHIEKRIYDALTTMVIKNLVAFSRAINQDKPLFQVDGLLSNPDVMLQPSINDIFKLTVQSIRDAVEVCKNFVRWMDGTCIETPAKDVPGQDEPYVFTFFDDISDNPVIHELLIQVTRREMTGVLQNLQKHCNHWKRFKRKWKTDMTSMMEKFAARNPSCMQYDYVLQSYLKDEQEINDQRVFFFVNCIRLNLKPLKQSVLEHAHSWLTSLGGLLNESTHNQLKALQGISKMMDKSKRILPRLFNLTTQNLPIRFHFHY